MYEANLFKKYMVIILEEKESPTTQNCKQTGIKPGFLVKSLVDFQSLPTKLRNIENFDLFVSSCKSFLLTN